MAETVTVVEVEALLRNGREVFLVLQLPRDTQHEADGVLTWRIQTETGVVDEHTVPRADLVYLHTRTVERGADPTGMRTLGRQRAQEAVPAGA